LGKSFHFWYQFWNNIIDSSIVAPYVTFNGVSEWFGTNVKFPQNRISANSSSATTLTKSLHTTAEIWYRTTSLTQNSAGFSNPIPTLEVDFTDDPSTILADKVTYPNGFATPGAVNSMSASSGNPYFDMPGGTKSSLGVTFRTTGKSIAS